MAGTTSIYGIHYPVLADSADITTVGTLASDVDALIAKVDAGEAIKQRVIAVAATNINLTALPAAVDGVTLATGDLFLCTAQSTASQNGLQRYSSAGNPSTRPTGFTDGTSAVPGRVAAGHVVVGGVGGTSNGGIWQNTNTGAITVDTTGLTYRKIMGAGAVGTTDLADLAVTAAKIASGTITATQIANSLKPTGTANDTDEALRALGTTSGKAAAGNDSRLSDTRTPTDASVTLSKIAGSLKPSGSAATSDEALRAIGITGSTACAGNDSRLPIAGEKSALAGTSGTPGSGNKYVTDADSRNTDTRTPSAASVTAAKLGVQSIGHMVKDGTAQTLTTSTQVYKVLGWTQKYETNNAYVDVDVANSRIVMAAVGIYRITCGMHHGNNATGERTAIVKILDTTEASTRLQKDIGFTPGQAFPRLAGPSFNYVCTTPGDVVTLSASQSSGGSVALPTSTEDTFLCVEYVGPAA